jgi:hypothetical protein
MSRMLRQPEDRKTAFDQACRGRRGCRAQRYEDAARLAQHMDAKRIGRPHGALPEHPGLGWHIGRAAPARQHFDPGGNVRRLAPGLTADDGDLAGR